MKIIKEDYSLEDKLKEIQKMIDDIINVVSTKLLENGFTQTNKINGISFNKLLDKEQYVLECQFYLNTDNNTYTSYVTSSDLQNSANYSQKGHIQDAEQAVDNFIKYINNLE